MLLPTVSLYVSLGHDTQLVLSSMYCPAGQPSQKAKTQYEILFRCLLLISGVVKYSQG